MHAILRHSSTEAVLTFYWPKARFKPIRTLTLNGLVFIKVPFTVDYKVNCNNFHSWKVTRFNISNDSYCLKVVWIPRSFVTSKGVKLELRFLRKWTQDEFDFLLQIFFAIVYWTCNHQVILAHFSFITSRKWPTWLTNAKNRILFCSFPIDLLIADSVRV